MSTNFSQIFLRPFYLYYFRFLLSLVVVLAFLVLDTYSGGFFQAPLLRALGGRALTSAFLSLGLPGGLALALGAVAKVLCHFDDVSGVLSGPLRMMPAGSDSAGNASSGSWEKYLNLPSDSEGQGQGIEEEPASRKRDRDADPIADAGPSSSQRVNPAAGPSRQVGQPLSEEEQRLALLGPDQLSQWVTARQFQIEDQINLLRKSEGMRPLGALRGEQVLIHFETVYGIGALETVLKDMQENGRESSFYQESKIEKHLPTEAELRKMDRNGKGN